MFQRDRVKPHFSNARMKMEDAYPVSWFVTITLIVRTVAMRETVRVVRAMSSPVITDTVHTSPGSVMAMMIVVITQMRMAVSLLDNICSNIVLFV